MSLVSIVITALIGLGLLVMALRGGSFGAVERLQGSIGIWWVLGVGVAFGALPQRRLSRPALVAALALIALAAWTTLGLLWTDSAERTSAEAVRVLGYTGLVVLVGWTFSARDRRIVVSVLAAVAGLVCILALVARLAPDLLSSDAHRAGFHTSRLDYPFNYWNALGCWSAMTMALALALSVDAQARAVRTGSLALATLAPVVVYLTYSRAALAGAVLGVVVVVVLSARRWLAVWHAVVAGAAATAVVITVRAAPEIARGSGSGGRGTVVLALVLAAVAAAAIAAVEPAERIGAVRVPHRARRPAIAAAGLVVLVAAVVVGPPLARSAWRSFEHTTEAQVADPAQRLTSLRGNRRDLWAVAIALFEDHPLHGIGAGTFEFAWNQDPRRSSHVVDAHSLYLESLAEVGLPGALLVLAAFAVLLVAALRAPPREGDGTARAASAGAGAAFLVFCVASGVDWMWESTAVCALGLILGTVAAADAAPAAGRLRLPLRVGLPVAAAVAIAVQLPLFAAASAIRSSQQSVQDGRFVDALREANDAAESESWGASGYLQRALVLEQVGRLGPAEVAAERATQLETANWQLWLVLGRIRAERGHVGPALAAVARARSLNPHSPLFHPGVARALRRGAAGLSGSP
jgi:O-antigen ligase